MQNIVKFRWLSYCIDGEEYVADEPLASDGVFDTDKYASKKPWLFEWYLSDESRETGKECAFDQPHKSDGTLRKVLIVIPHSLGLNFQKLSKMYENFPPTILMVSFIWETVLVLNTHALRDTYQTNPKGMTWNLFPRVPATSRPHPKVYFESVSSSISFSG